MGIKKPRGNRKDKCWKIKCFTGARHVDIKHRGQVVSCMIVRRRAVYPKVVSSVY